MNSTNQNPPEINPMLKMSIGSIISNPVPDDELLTIQGDKKLFIVVVCAFIDIFLLLVIFLQEYDFLLENFKNDFLEFCFKSILTILILGSIIVLFCLHKLLITQITRFAYIIFGTIYYVIQFVIKLLKLINEAENLSEEDEEDIDFLDIIFLIIQLTTIIPRIIAFFICKVYVEKLKKIKQIKDEAEHESFVEKIASRIEKGYTRWSNPNASYYEDSGPAKKQYFDKKEENINDDNEEEKVVFTINGNKNEEK